MTRHLGWTLALALSLLTPWARSQGALPTLPDRDRVLWTGSVSGGGNFGPVEVARLTPEHGKDAVLLRDGELVIAYAPHLHNLVAPIATGVYGIGIREGTGPNGLDQVVFSDDLGLSFAQYTPTGPDPLVISQLSGTGAFAEAAEIVCADFNGDGFVDLASIDEDGTTIRTILAGDGGGMTIGPVMSLTNTILDIEPIEWSTSPGNAGHELAVLTTANVCVSTIGSAVLWMRTSPAPDHSMTVLKQPGTAAPERLALVQRSSSAGPFQLSVHDALVEDAPLSLTISSVVHIDSGDFDGDGDDDVGINFAGGLLVKVYENVNGFFTGSHDDVAVGNMESTAGSPPFPPNLADLCLADVDDDEDEKAELLMGSIPNEWLAVRAFPGSINSSSWQPCSTAPECQNPVIHFFVSNDGPNENYVPTTFGANTGTNGQLGCVFTVMNHVGPITNGDLQMEVILWLEDVGGAAQELELERHLLYALTSEFKAAKWNTMEIGFTLPAVAESATEDVAIPDLYYAEFRLVTVQNGQVVGDPHRTFAIGFTGELIVQPTGANGDVDLLLAKTGVCPCAGTGLYAPEVDDDDPPYVGGFAPILDIQDLGLTVPRIGVPVAANP